MAITEAQQNFLSHFSRSGDVDDAMASQKIEICHLMSWCQNNSNFDLEYRRMKKFFLTHAREEMYLNAVRNIQEAFRVGYVSERRISQSVKRDGDGNVVSAETKVDTIEKGIPPIFYKFALNESVTTQAIQQMANEGLLSNDQYRQLIALTDRISEESSAIFEGQNPTEQITEKKAVALIKQAVLGLLPD